MQRKRGRKCMLLGSKFQEVERMEWMKALTPFINSIMDNSQNALPLTTNLSYSS
jgi:hypothetical protein